MNCWSGTSRSKPKRPWICFWLTFRELSNGPRGECSIFPSGWTTWSVSFSKKSPNRGRSTPRWFRKPCCRWPRRYRRNPAAGVDAARARFADRNTVRSTPDTKDRKAARTLLENSHKEETPETDHQKRVYEQAWFQAIGLASMLAAIVALVYVAFSTPPEKVLFAECRKVMEAGDWEAQVAARKDGPIRKFLKSYGNSGTPSSAQVHEWADGIDEEMRERSLVRRKSANLTPENEMPKLPPEKP